MRRKTLPLDKQVAAYMYAEQRRSQQYIAKFLGVSQSVVSRLLKEAETEGLLETRVRFMSRRVSIEQFNEIKARASPRGIDLARRLSERSKEEVHRLRVEVVPSASNETSTAAWTYRIQQFAVSTTERIIKPLLVEASALGVAWGENVGAVVQELKASCPAPPRANSPVQCVPLIGEPLGRAISRFSSSRLAADLDQVLNGGNEHSLSLALVPALIPQGFSNEEVAAIREFISYVPAYREVFGGKNGMRDDGSEPWVRRLDAILTSVSPADRPLGFDHDSMVKSARLSRTQLLEAVIGDICGALIPRNGYERQVEQINQFWNGITLEDIRRCREQASPGVIVVAVGKNKSRSVYDAVLRGFVNHLIIDQDLADGLDELCDAGFLAS